MVGGVEEESEDGEFAVVEGDGGDFKAKEGKGVIGFDGVGDEFGDERFLDVFVRLEDVLVDAGE